MGIHMWCFVAPMLLVSVRAGLHEHVAQSFYEPPKASSPSPIPAPTQPTPSELVGMKEVILFLTPDQVQALHEAGAIVRPFPEYESQFAELQEQIRKNIEKQKQQNHQTVPLSVVQNGNVGVQNYYKNFNIQEINDYLTQQGQTTEGTPEMTTKVPRYKYTKSRQQNKEKEYTPYVPKKTNRTKPSNQNSNSEYVRFLPIYENENLKMIPYQALPLFPYKFDEEIFIETNVKPQQNAFIQTIGQQNDFNQPNVEIQHNAYTVNDESQRNTYSQENENIQQNAYLRGKEGQQGTYSQVKAETQLDEYAQANKEAERDAFLQAAKENEKQNAHFQAHSRTQENVIISPLHDLIPVEEETEKPEAIVEVPAPALGENPESVQTFLKPLDTSQFKETLTSIEGLPSLEEQQEKPETPASPLPTVQTPILVQDKLAQLLAPLYKHQAITETITQQKEELIKSELNIHHKLQQIKEAPEHNHEEYASEIEKLAKNLVKQNALAKIEAVSNTPASVLINQETTESAPIAFAQSTALPVTPLPLVRIPKPHEVNIPAPFPAPVEFLRPVPLLLPKQAKIGTEQIVSGPSNIYVKLGTPHTIPKFISFPDQHKFPGKFPMSEPDQLTILRDIWEH